MVLSVAEEKVRVGGGVRALELEEEEVVRSAWAQRLATAALLYVPDSGWGTIGGPVAMTRSNWFLGMGSLLHESHGAMSR